MRKISRFFLKGTNWALTGVLALFGAVGCDPIGPDEYGTPFALYSIKGKVTNTRGEAIPGIQVVAESERLLGEYEKNPYYSAKTITDDKGDYAIPTLFSGVEAITVFAKDIDGEANGLYLPKDSVVKSIQRIAGNENPQRNTTTEVTINISLEEGIDL